MNYIRTLINLFYTKPESVSRSEHIKLQIEYEALKAQYEEMRKQLLFSQSTHRDVPIAGFDSLDVEPVKTKDRSQYIADVTLFFENIFHRKLQVSVAEIRELLSNIGRQEGTPLSMSRVEYDMFLRGMEAMCWKIHDWAQSLDAESRQYLQDEENNN